MWIQFDTARTLKALCLVTFTLLIENVQLNSNIWIVSGNTPVPLQENEINERVLRFDLFVCLCKSSQPGRQTKTIRNEWIPVFITSGKQEEIYVYLFSEMWRKCLDGVISGMKRRNKHENRLKCSTAAHTYFFEELRFFYPFRSKTVFKPLSLR